MTSMDSLLDEIDKEIAKIRCVDDGENSDWAFSAIGAWGKAKELILADRERIVKALKEKMWKAGDFEDYEVVDYTDVVAIITGKAENV